VPVGTDPEQDQIERGRTVAESLTQQRLVSTGGVVRIDLASHAEHVSGAAGRIREKLVVRGVVVGRDAPLVDEIHLHTVASQRAPFAEQLVGALRRRASGDGDPRDITGAERGVDGLLDQRRRAL
jgi:hypothetical protein